MKIPTFNISNSGGDNQLKKLLVHKKIVFRFRLSPQSELELFAYGASENSKQFTKSEQLSVSPSLPGLTVTEDFYLGNLEITKKTGFDELEECANSGTYNYIHIQPTGFHNSEVIYEISGDKTAALTPVSLAVKMNPSPPYGGE